MKPYETEILQMAFDKNPNLVPSRAISLEFAKRLSQITALPIAFFFENESEIIKIAKTL